MFGPHSSYIIGSYAMFFGLLATLIVFIWVRGRKAKQKMEFLDAQLAEIQAGETPHNNQSAKT